MGKKLCIYCGKEKPSILQKCPCGYKGKPKAYLRITNIMSEIIPLLEPKQLSSDIYWHLECHYICPNCFGELPNERYCDAAGSMDNKPGKCPKCESDEKRKAG